MINVGVYPNMRGGFELKRSALGIGVEFAVECALDVLGSRVVTFDKIAVIGIHDAHERREVGGSAWMKGLPQSRRCRGKFRDDISDLFAGFVETRGFNALNSFKQGHMGRFGLASSS